MSDRYDDDAQYAKEVSWQSRDESLSYLPKENKEILNQPLTTNREATKMTKSVIALPTNLDQALRNLTILKPTVSRPYQGPKIPVGPKMKPVGAKAGGTRYTAELLSVVVHLIYDELYTFQEIANTLNAYGHRSAHKRLFTSQAVRNSIYNNEGWAMIEPRWTQWQLANPSLFND